MIELIRDSTKFIFKKIGESEIFNALFLIDLSLIWVGAFSTKYEIIFYRINLTRIAQKLEAILFSKKSVFIILIVFFVWLIILDYLAQSPWIQGKILNFGKENADGSYVHYNLFAGIRNFKRLLYYFFHDFWIVLFTIIVFSLPSADVFRHYIKFEFNTNQLIFAFNLLTSLFLVFIRFFKNEGKNNLQFKYIDKYIDLKKTRYLIINSKIKENKEFIFIKDRESGLEIFYLVTSDLSKGIDEQKKAAIIDYSNNFFVIKYEFEKYSGKIY